MSATPTLRPLPRPALGRRRCLGLLGGLLAAPGSALGQADPWARYKTRFVSADGRVVDTGNGGQSHSEGQGWGMMLAVHHDDRATFDRMLRWTRASLRRDADMLHVWRWMPGPVPVADRNNATDGDLFIAAALLRASERWGDPALAEEGTAIARDVLRLLVRRVADMLVLLPGSRGFEHRSHVVLNPSYYALPAIATVAEAVPDPAWLRLVTDGVRLMRSARFGRWGLPPDWIAVSRSDGRVSPAQGWPPRFAYDAVRVPLWHAWAGLSDETVVGRPVAFWTDSVHRHVPAWADLTTDATSPYAAGQGVSGIARFAALRSGASLGRSVPDWRGEGRDYYDTSLAMLVRMAAAEAGVTL